MKKLAVFVLIGLFGVCLLILDIFVRNGKISLIGSVLLIFGLLSFIISLEIEMRKDD